MSKPIKLIAPHQVEVAVKDLTDQIAGFKEQANNVHDNPELLEG